MKNVYSNLCFCDTSGSLERVTMIFRFINVIKNKESLDVENKKDFLTQRHFWINRPRNEPLKEKRWEKLSQRALEMMFFPWNGGMSPLKGETFPCYGRPKPCRDIKLKTMWHGQLWKIHPAVLCQIPQPLVLTQSRTSCISKGIPVGTDQTRHWNQALGEGLLTCSHREG